MEVCAFLSAKMKKNLLYHLSIRHFEYMVSIVKVCAKLLSRKHSLV